MVARIFPHGAVELFDKDDHTTFKVNGQRLKPYLAGFSTEVLEEMVLREPDATT